MSNYITTNEADIKLYDLYNTARKAINTTGKFVYDKFTFTDIDLFRIYERHLRGVL